MSSEIPYKIYLEENEMPKQWYNVRADMKNLNWRILCFLASFHDIGAYKTNNLKDFVGYEFKAPMPHTTYGYLISNIFHLLRSWLPLSCTTIPTFYSLRD